jgi:acyl-CoA synthetase (AMP-forming)/AMP-acid ligase II/thioesterase domain-containing protein/acyl carrier protein
MQLNSLEPAVEPVSTSSATIYQVVKQAAKKSPDAAALMAPERQPLSFAGLCALIESVEQDLNRLGIGRQDRVAVVLANGPELAVSFLAVSAAATCAPLNPAYRENEFAFYLEDLSARALIVEQGVDSPARAAAAQLHIPVLELVRKPDREAGAFSLAGQSRSASSAGGFAAAEDCALVLHTSGTTSRPKRVPLTQANLCASARHIRNTLQLTPADRCLNVMPLFHIHGLIGAVLSSLSAGASVVCTPGYRAEEFLSWLAAFRPTWYTAVPTIHRSIATQAAQSGQDLTKAGLRLIRSSSSALAPQLLAELERIFAVPVLEAYGMTEASHQMCCNPLPPKVHKPGSVGRAAGPEVAIMDEGGRLLEPRAVGEIVIRGPNVTAGYEGQPSANATPFTNGWFRTGDQGYCDEVGYFYVTGRLKELINRGGEKIIPREVDEVLLSHPAVGQAVTFAVPHDRLGEDIAAAVMLRNGSRPSPRELREFTREKLAVHKVPSQIVIVDEIPKGPTGKLQRIGLYQKLAHLLQPEYVAPAGELEQMLARIWCELLGLERVGVRENFFYLGGDSLLAGRLFAEIEKRLGKKLPLITLWKEPTIAELARIIADASATRTQAQVVEIQPRGSRPPLVFLPSLVGDICYPQSVVKHLSVDLPVFGIQPSHEGKQTYAPLETIAARYVDLLTEFQKQGPYFLAGYSFAGLLAYEMARQLTARDCPVAFVGLLDTTPRPIGRQGVKLPAFLLNSLWWLKDDLLQTRPREIVARLRRHTGAARKHGLSVFSSIPSTQVELESLFPVSHLPTSYREAMEANLRASREYVCQPYAGRVTLFRARTRPLFRPLQADLGWGKLAQHGVDVRVVPGHHGSILKEPYVRRLAVQLQEALDQVVCKT